VKVNSIETQNGSVTLKINGYAGHGYQLQTSSDLGSTPWVDLDAPQLGAGQELTFSINSIPGATRHFYRIAVGPWGIQEMGIMRTIISTPPIHPIPPAIPKTQRTITA
jgi:hypothetical protein